MRLSERTVERDVGRVRVLDGRGRLDLLRVHARQRAQESERQTIIRPGRAQLA